MSLQFIGFGILVFMLCLGIVDALWLLWNRVKDGRR